MSEDQRPIKYGWTIHSMHFGRDFNGPFLFFVDGNSNQHRIDFNEKQVLLMLSQMPDVIETAPC